MGPLYWSGKGDLTHVSSCDNLSPFSTLVRSRASARGLLRKRNYTSAVFEALEDARYAPSAFNVQPWRSAVLDDPEDLSRLCEAAHNQQKVADAGAAVVFMAHLSPEACADDVQLDATLNASEQAKHTRRCAEIYASRRSAIGDMDVARELRESTFLAAMIFMLSLWERGIASCPLGGFNPIAVAELLALPADLDPVLIVVAGDSDGKGTSKTRLPLSFLLYDKHVSRSVRPISSRV
jgi:nitroreductase